MILILYLKHDVILVPEDDMILILYLKHDVSLVLEDLYLEMVNEPLYVRLEEDERLQACVLGVVQPADTIECL
jgi:hypothetical protein